MEQETNELEMFEPVSGLEDLTGILESLFAEAYISVRLDMQEEQGEHVWEHILAQFAGTLEMCDIVQAESGQDVALEFLFREVNQAQEPYLVTLPIDPQDIEVDLQGDQVVLQSTKFTLTLHRLGV